jgi:hypothetical protein
VKSDGNLERRKLFLILFCIIILGESVIVAFTQINPFVRIHSSGTIAVQENTHPARVREVREVQIIDWSTVAANDGHCNWTTIAETLASCGMTGMAVPLLCNYKAYYPSQYVSWASDRDELALAVEAAHQFNLTVRLEFLVLYKSPNTEWRVKLQDNSTLNWLDPTNPEAREHVLNLTIEAVTNYAIDDFCLDYIRYDGNNMPYTDSAKEWLEDYLNEEITEWPGAFAPGGSNFTEFLEFRMVTINTLVEEIYDTVKSINPNVTVSADTRRWWTGNPAPHLHGTAQDVPSWVSGGYIDRLYPMTYVDNIEEAETAFDAYLEYAVAGPEGAVPICPYFSVRPAGSFIDPENMSILINYSRNRGLDGFSIQGYGGPGDNPNNPDPLPDIRNYTEALYLPEIWELYNMTIHVNENSINITWRTTVPTTSMVEYNSTLLFDAVLEYWEEDPWPLHYWNLEYYQGTKIQNSTLTLEHQILINGLANGTYYYRIQSVDGNSTLTTSVMTFTIGS